MSTGVVNRWICRYSVSAVSLRSTCASITVTTPWTMDCGSTMTGKRISQIAAVARRRPRQLRRSDKVKDCLYGFLWSSLFLMSPDYHSIDVGITTHVLVFLACDWIMKLTANPLAVGY